MTQLAVKESPHGGGAPSAWCEGLGLTGVRRVEVAEALRRPNRRRPAESLEAEWPVEFLDVVESKQMGLFGAGQVLSELWP